MKPIYIHSAAVISAQDSFRNDEPLEFHPILEEKAGAQHPNYSDFIAPGMARRMAPAVKMGVATAKKALSDVSLSRPDAIITGSGMGCMQDTEKFLNTLMENKEAYLTPTAFIQSTHNTVGAQIALELGCHGYNNTFVHGSLSFESALLDAQLYLMEHPKANVLVGGVDELGIEFVGNVLQIEQGNPEGIRVPLGEGAGFMSVSHEKSTAGIAVNGIRTQRIVEERQIAALLKSFLEDHDTKLSEIDSLFTGHNGDGFDRYYSKVTSLFPTTEITKFKQFCGEFHTASAFGLWMAYELLKKHDLFIDENELNKNNTYKKVLLYNQLKGKNHSFMLLSQC